MVVRLKNRFRDKKFLLVFAVAILLLISIGIIAAERMAWQIILGLPVLILLHPEPAIIFWAANGVPAWQTCLLVIPWISITIIFTYYGTGLGEIFLKFLKKVLLKRIKRVRFIHGLAVILEERRGRKREKQKMKDLRKIQKGWGKFRVKTIGWLKRQKAWIIITLAFMPIPIPIPGLGLAFIATTKLLRIKYGLLILLCGNAFRVTLITYAIYRGVSFFLQ